MLLKTATAMLEDLGCQYAFYIAAPAQTPMLIANNARFLSASLIKVPILLAWLALEARGEVSRTEICDLDAEEPVQGAGFSWLLHQRRLPYADVMLMMIALSDNLCTNLVIRHIGLERLNQIFQTTLGLTGTQLQRKLFDYAARARGLDNWISAADCIHLYQYIADLDAPDRSWVETLLEVNQDSALLLRDIPRDTLVFRHKTGSITGVLHDWGYTDTCQMFLLTQNVQDEPAAFAVFGALGRLMQSAAGLS